MEWRLDLSSDRTDRRRYAFPVGRFTAVSAQVIAEYNISGTYAVAFYRSIDGVNGVAPEEGSQSLAAAGMTATLNSSGYPYLIAEVTTNATSGFVKVLVCGKADRVSAPV